MTSAAVLGLGFAATALTARQLILAGEAWMLAPPKLRQFYKGGFDEQMSRREAALILGIRESAAKNKVMEAHRKVMMANHPDAGGSPFVSTKVNEAKEVLFRPDARPRKKVPCGGSTPWGGTRLVKRWPPIGP